MNRIVNWRLALLLVLGVLATASLILLPTIREEVAQFLAWVRDNKFWGAVLLAAVYVPAAVFVPGSLLTMGAGYALGLVAGTVAVSVGATLGACAAFWLSRTVARGWVEKKIAGNPRFLALDQAVAREGFKIVLLTRLSPVFPFTLLNYAFGLTRVRFRDYAVASWLGMLPGGIMYVYLGMAVGEVSELVAGNVEAPPAQKIALLVVGLLATVVVTILITRLARQALARTAPEVVGEEKQNQRNTNR